MVVQDHALIRSVFTWLTITDDYRALGWVFFYSFQQIETKLSVQSGRKQLSAEVKRAGIKCKQRERNEFKEFNDPHQSVT